jgi:hypothetical protein
MEIAASEAVDGGLGNYMHKWLSANSFHFLI